MRFLLVLLVIFFVLPEIAISKEPFDRGQDLSLSTDYQIYYVPDLNAYFYLDEIPDGIKCGVAP